MAKESVLGKNIMCSDRASYKMIIYNPESQSYCCASYKEGMTHYLLMFLLKAFVLKSMCLRAQEPAKI